jgi:hypothetical protein
VTTTTSAVGPFRGSPEIGLYLARLKVEQEQFDRLTGEIEFLESRWTVQGEVIKAIQGRITPKFKTAADQSTVKKFRLGVNCYSAQSRIGFARDDIDR